MNIPFGCIFKDFKEKTMKNTKTWLGILVMVLIFGMTVAGCADGSTSGSSDHSGSNDQQSSHLATIILRNEYSNPITEFHYFSKNYSGLNITQNDSQTFYYNMVVGGATAGGTIIIFAEGLTYFYNDFTISGHTRGEAVMRSDRTTTITLTSTGNIISSLP